jgi:3-dehydroquinate dehydratase/shikimate dehydrogenase
LEVWYFFQDIGAVNTIIRKPDEKLVGYNTDYVGAISAIEDGIRGLYMSLYIGIYYC